VGWVAVSDGEGSQQLGQTAPCRGLEAACTCHPASQASGCQVPTLRLFTAWIFTTYSVLGLSLSRERLRAKAGGGGGRGWSRRMRGGAGERQWTPPPKLPTAPACALIAARTGLLAARPQALAAAMASRGRAGGAPPLPRKGLRPQAARQQRGATPLREGVRRPAPGGSKGRRPQPAPRRPSPHPHPPGPHL
jgi:hypothetical protein